MVPFEDKFAGLSVLDNVCRETHSGRAFARGVDATRGDLVDILEKLGLGYTWITDEKNVDFSSVQEFRTTRDAGRGL